MSLSCVSMRVFMLKIAPKFHIYRNECRYSYRFTHTHLESPIGLSLAGDSWPTLEFPESRDPLQNFINLNTSSGLLALTAWYNCSSSSLHFCTWTL